MSPPALSVSEDEFNRKSNDSKWQGFNNFSRENPNPNFTSSSLPCPPVKEDSFRMVLPLAMSPPRDNAVPLPALPKPMMKPKKNLSHQESMLSLRKTRYPEKNQYPEVKDFKCIPFCLSLPGFGRQKPVRSPKSDDSTVQKKMMKASSFSNNTRASLEKFECGSRASATAMSQENNPLYFDLPVEMIKCGGRDVQETVSSSFFFDKESGGLALRSVLKTRSSLSGKQRRGSAETSPRRVRFSTTSSVSCPTSPRTCITPRLLKAREDFNAFLTAQNE